MRALLVVLAVLCVASNCLAQAAVSLADLRAQLQDVGEDSLSSEELVGLSEKALSLARETTSRGRFWSTMGFVAELCAAGPYDRVHEIRARALGILVERFSDSLRWSSLLTRRFVPRFDQIPRKEWSRELTEYDRVLDRLYENATNKRVQADLLYAKAWTRVHVNRRWDWLTDEDRRNTIRILNTIETRFGDLACPGSGGPSVETVGARARQHYYELEELYFGAAAPRTSGVDLEGQPIDVAEYRGKIVVLDFWTTFCPSCLAMVPSIRALLENLEDEPVVYLGVNGDADRRQGLGTARRVKMTWRNLWDGPQGPNGPLATTWNVPAEGWPAVFVIDASGRIRHKLWGKQQVDENLENAIDTLLDELRATER